MAQYGTVSKNELLTESIRIPLTVAQLKKLTKVAAVSKVFKVTGIIKFMSTDNSKNEASAEAPKETPKKASKEECTHPANPTGKHDLFKPEDGKPYCRYCGKTG